MNAKGFGQKQLCPNPCAIPAIVRRDWGNPWGILVGIMGVQPRFEPSTFRKDSGPLPLLLPAQCWSGNVSGRRVLCLLPYHKAELKLRRKWLVCGVAVTAGQNMINYPFLWKGRSRELPLLRASEGAHRKGSERRWRQDEMWGEQPALFHTSSKTRIPKWSVAGLDGFDLCFAWHIWDITQCRPWKRTYRHYFQGRRIHRARKQRESRWQSELWLSADYTELYPRIQCSS
jgi:hypothetical protein